MELWSSFRWFLFLRCPVRSLLFFVSFLLCIREGTCELPVLASWSCASPDRVVLAAAWVSSSATNAGIQMLCMLSWAAFALGSDSPVLSVRSKLCRTGHRSRAALVSPLQPCVSRPTSASFSEQWSAAPPSASLSLSSIRVTRKPSSAAPARSSSSPDADSLLPMPLQCTSRPVASLFGLFFQVSAGRQSEAWPQTVRAWLADSLPPSRVGCFHSVFRALVFVCSRLFCRASWSSPEVPNHPLAREHIVLACICFWGLILGQRPNILKEIWGSHSSPLVTVFGPSIFVIW
jgi:hypothetical protein